MVLIVACFGIDLLVHGQVLGGVAVLIVSVIALALAIIHEPEASDAEETTAQARPPAPFLSSSGLVFTTSPVLYEGYPILVVRHDAKDGAWQFVNGYGDTDIGMQPFPAQWSHIVALDDSITALADLPAGWRARRRERGDDWVREVEQRS